METRLLQPIQSQEEQWLAEAIKKRNIDSAEYLIKLIQTKDINPNSLIPHPSLRRADEEGNSFLSLSILNKTESVTRLLLELQGDNDDILFAVNKKNQTLIWQAAQANNSEILEQLLTLSIKKYQPLQHGIQPWCSEDIDGNMPLHVSAMLENIKTVTILLKIMKETLSPDAFINRINKSNLAGNAPLHLAIQETNIPAIIALTESGADWDLINNRDKSAVDYFFAHTIEFQNFVFTHLQNSQNRKTAKELQIRLLNLYQKTVFKKISPNHPENNKVILDNYYSLAAKVSLKDLIIAKAATDKTFQIIITNEPSSLIHGDLPFQQENEKKKDKTDENNIDITDQPLSDYQQINTDRKILITLIKEIEEYVLDLENNSRQSGRNRSLAIILPILGWLIYGAVEGWFLYERFVILPSLPCKRPHNDHCDDNRYLSDPLNTIFKTAIFGTLGAIAALANSFFTPLLFWNKEATISKEEWKNIIQQLEQHILEKLAELNEQQAPKNNIETINALRAQLALLADHQDRKEVINIFKQIAIILKRIQTELNQGYYKNGITLFKTVKEQQAEFEIIEMKDEETHPLLQMT